MSNLYATIQGERGPATRCGNRRLSCHIRGWNSGIRVEAKHTEEGDSFFVFKTRGSNGPGSEDYLIGEIGPGDTGAIMSTD